MSYSKELVAFYFNKGPDIIDGAKIKCDYLCRKEVLTGLDRIDDQDD